MDFISFFVTIAGLAVTVVASRWVVQNASQLAYGTDVPPYFLGITIVALGTDGPEIANSIMASIAGHGDLNVGNATGSVFAQITFALGILPFAAKGFTMGPWRNAIVPSLTTVALILSGFLFLDGFYSRIDGALLVVAYLLATYYAWKYAQPFSEPVLEEPSRSKVGHFLLMIAALGLVVAGAGAAVQGLLGVSATLGVPEYVVSFFGTSVGTSLPEIVVTIQATKLGQRDLAMGDILGACLLDSTLASGIGPVISPTFIDTKLAVEGVLLAVVAMAMATVMLWGRGKHDRWSGAVLLLIYAGAYVVLLDG